MKITFGMGLYADPVTTADLPHFCGCIHIDVWPQDKSPEGYERAYAEALQSFYPDGQPKGCNSRCSNFPVVIPRDPTT